jgi:iron complex outermembrane receptor protein
MYRLSSLSAFWLLIFMLSISSISMAQNDTIQEMLKFRIDDMYEQVKEDLLNVKVSIASKKSENLFVAPFSASVVTKEDIEKAGCNSIMEAFRLVPGLIVQEQTNGNYDIYIRGGSNVQHNTIFSRSANTTTLVMIDNRPIYNYYQGGTFWETIPIDLHDVERIELVRGATSAMYGPNAASGVINIITRKTKEDGLYLVANATQGNFGTVIGNVAAGYKFSEQFSVILSGNLQERERTQNTYYTYTADDYVPREGLPSFPDPILNFPDTDLALHKEGLNLFANFKPSERLQFSLSGGWQDSRVQKVYSENFSTPLNTSLSNTWYGD